MKEMRNGQLTGIEKIAVLMNVIGKEKSGELLKQMKDSDVRRLLKVMSSMKKAPVQLINDVLKEYLYKLSEKDEIIFEENLSEPELISQVLGSERAKQIFGGNRAVNLVERKSLTVLETVDPKTLAEFLVDEHPQTIALIIAHMDVEQQITMIKALPDNLRPEIVTRMATLEYVSPEKIDELDEVLKRDLIGKAVGNKNQFGGVPAIADLINNLDKRTMTSLMTRLEDKDPILAVEIKQHIFSFTDVIKIDNRGLQLVLRDVPNQTLLLALKNAPEELREKLYEAMSERAAA
ncbi:MAG: flagellar motor switch protein FliG, partial [Proteobacteria bacterium]|nr:flagellar motor switch protein FliG [Pseudomonadota bacterium]